VKRLFNNIMMTRGGGGDKEKQDLDKLEDLGE
jgi:hypothetical protein